MIEGRITAHDSGAIIVDPDLSRGSDVLEFPVGRKVHLLTEAEYRELDCEANDQSYQVGYDEGYEVGKDEADDGQEAYEEGRSEGYDEGFAAGRAEAEKEQD